MLGLLVLRVCRVIILSLVRKNEARKHAGCDESQGRKKLHTGSFLWLYIFFCSYMLALKNDNGILLERSK